MSVIDQASRLSGHSGSVKLWRYDWCSPPKNEDENDQENYDFQFKRWQRVPKVNNEASDSSNGLDDDQDYLDLNLYDRFRASDGGKVPSQISSTNKPASGLTMDDIRGAVGGVESIPGFSSSDTVSKKETEKPASTEDTKDTKDTKASEESTPANTEGSKDANAQDGDGDVSMD
ncbi:HFR107Wp [Eremothecium sinecaudum]|uniref:HFR107Wp n=1 Tax=Eremothecium sinecaudum TaxID=45286 RepID=A0A109UXX1_9SACH|nr:HFR107Wp [Eremothecium sinecaudum]AMD21962.1 HFR107Wp [Eremothecium sinecaudum]